jgi:hypothetical protein
MDTGLAVAPLSRVVADYMVENLSLNLFDDILRRTWDIAKQCGVVQTMHSGPDLQIHLDPRLKQAARDCGHRWGDITPAWHDPEILFSSVALWLQRGLIKISEPVAEKARSSPFGGALDFRGGDGGDDPLRRAALLGLALNLVDYPR